MTEIITPSDYQAFVDGLKRRVRAAQIRASLSVNSELVRLYWQIGHDILDLQAQRGWGARVIDRLASDLRHAFPDMKGFSTRNLKYMRSFAQVWTEIEFVQQAVAQIPWGHNVRIMEKVTDPEARRFYVHKTLEHGWSRSILLLQIEQRLHERQGKALSNFDRTLIPPQSDLAQQLTKDPYCFDFLTLADDVHERDLERGLVQHIQNFLLELGVGFSFVGTQVHLEVGNQDFYLDMLFYHLKLRCYVVVELKAGVFKPEYAGKLNFYLSAADDLLRHEHDQPTIGILLCKSKDDVVVEYALRDVNKPIGVAGWETQLVESLPDELKGSLPTIAQIEEELNSGSSSGGQQ